MFSYIGDPDVTWPFCPSYDHCLAKLRQPPSSPRYQGAGTAGANWRGENPYEQLEAKFTASFQNSPWPKAFELLDLPDLGDLHPSTLMDQMLALLPRDMMPNLLFLALFLRRLPEDMCDQLASQDLRTRSNAMVATAKRFFDPRPPGAHRGYHLGCRRFSPIPVTCTRSLLLAQLPRQVSLDSGQVEIDTR
jgi:hypothetical protein